MVPSFAAAKRKILLFFCQETFYRLPCYRTGENVNPKPETRKAKPTNRKNRMTLNMNTLSTFNNTKLTDPEE